MSTMVDQLLAHKGRQIWSVAPETTVREAVALFGEREIGAVLVCEAHHLIGMLTERDCIRKLLWQGRCTLESPVREVMRTDVPAVSPHDTIQHCMGLMNDRRTRHMPVLDGEQVVGVISMGDVIHTLLLEQECLIASLEGYISGSPSARPSAH
jgi:CBS domain-containing protein